MQLCNFQIALPWILSLQMELSQPYKAYFSNSFWRVKQMLKQKPFQVTRKMENFYIRLPKKNLVFDSYYTHIKYKIIIKMKIDSQRLGFKLQSLDQRYSRRMQQNLSGSRETFCDLQTPGWTSLMRSQISERTKRNAADKQSVNLKQMSIYNKLNQLQKLDWSEHDEKKMLKPKIYDKNQTRDSDQQRNTQHQSQQKNKKKEKDSKEKRWNQISVHDHLYQNSHKLQSQRMIRKILDQQFKRKQIFKFTPTINKKSIILAQSKFLRDKENQQLIREEKDQNTLQTEATQVKGKQSRDVERYRLLNRIFYFLSEENALLTEKQLCNTAIKLPLPCLKVIQPLVSRIYQGQKMQWLDFLQGFNDKAIKGKEGFYTLMQKWFMRNDKNKEEQSERINK